MGGLGPGEVARVAKLARLALAPDEMARLAADLEAITEAFAGLAERAASLPSAPQEEAGPLRADETSPFEAPDEVLATAPRVDASGAVRVPRGRGS